MSYINALYTSLMKKRLSAIDAYAQNAGKIQHEQWESLIRKALRTEYGEKYGFFRKGFSKRQGADTASVYGALLVN